MCVVLCCSLFSTNFATFCPCKTFKRRWNSLNSVNASKAIKTTKIKRSLSFEEEFLNETMPNIQCSNLRSVVMIIRLHKSCKFEFKIGSNDHQTAQKLQVFAAFGLFLNRTYINLLKDEQVDSLFRHLQESDGTAASERETSNLLKVSLWQKIFSKTSKFVWDKYSFPGIFLSCCGFLAYYYREGFTDLYWVLTVSHYFLASLCC